MRCTHAHAFLASTGLETGELFWPRDGFRVRLQFHYDERKCGEGRENAVSTFPQILGAADRRPFSQCVSPPAER